MFANPRFRAAIYALAAALGGVLTVYGVLNDEQLASILGVVGAAVNVMAFMNTPSAPAAQPEPEDAAE